MNASALKPAWVAIAATAAALIFSTPPARAAHLEDFQVDGDAKAATCGHAFPNANTPPTPPYLSCSPEQPDDWDSLYDCVNPDPVTKLCTKKTGSLADTIADMVDEFNSLDADNFTQGTKDDENVTAWRWGAAGGSAKTNIMESFAAKYDGILYIGGNRDINNGDANFGIWLLQNQTTKCTVAMVSAGTCATAGTFVGAPDTNGFQNLVPHKLGDILIVSAFTNGGTVANIQVYKVIQSLATKGGTVNPGDNAVPGYCPSTAISSQIDKSTGTTGVCLQQLIGVTKQGTGLCNDGAAGIPADAACAATNAIAVDALDPRFLSSQSGSVTGQYPALTFFEVGLNLVDLNLTTECFPNYVVEGRESQSVTASLNDFTIGVFQSCNSGILTQASGPVTVGQDITDTATLSGSGDGITPTGTITFKAYSDSTCTTQVNTTSTKTVTGFGDYTSDPYTTTFAGTIYWIASYSGDANFPAATGACGDANESSVVNKKQPSISTTVSSASVNINDKIWDTATLSNAYGSATGTITFTLYAPGDTTCSTAIATYAVSVSGNGADSRNTNPANTGYTVTTAGTYRWKASYDGDSNNLGATSACDAELVVVAKNSPTIATTPKVQLIMTAVATLNGAAGTPSGTFDFKLYTTADCSGSPLFAALGVTYSGNITTTSGTLPSASTYYTSGVTFKWQVHYSGDANNNSADSACGETVSISFQ